MRSAIFTLLFASYAYFYQAGGWNQNSRFDLVRAVTNDHAVRIDPYQRNTGDKALYDGHYYSDKAPGLALAAIPIAEAGRLALLASGGDPESFAGLAILSYLATVLTVGLLTALAGVVLYDLSIELGASMGGALFAATAFGLATPMWTLATLFIGHAMAAAGLLLAFAATARIGGERDLRSNLKLAAAAGVSAGWATVAEFPAAIPAVMIALWACWRTRTLGRKGLRAVTALALGALACAAVLMAYQYTCFGSPFHLAYSSEEGFEEMKQGWFGLNLPRVIGFWRILFGDYRGLLPIAPVLALAPIGLVVIGRRARGAAMMSTLIAVFYVLLNAGYTYWEGGWSFGPRHLSPAIPFLCLGLAGLDGAAAGRVSPSRGGPPLARVPRRGPGAEHADLCPRQHRPGVLAYAHRTQGRVESRDETGSVRIRQPRAARACLDRLRRVARARCEIDGGRS